MILDASKEYKTGRAQNELLTSHVDKIYEWYQDFLDVSGVAKVVTLDEIAVNEYNLNIPSYGEPIIEQETLSVEEAMKQLRESAELAFAAEEKLIDILKKEGLLI
nr:N-6 DNA methylase [Methanospirillum sp.]